MAQRRTDIITRHTMHSRVRSLILAVVAASATATPAFAQASGGTASGRDPQVAQATGLTKDLLEDIGQVERKMLALARAIPEEKFGWRPGEGVRSVSEVV